MAPMTVPQRAKYKIDLTVDKALNPTCSVIQQKAVHCRHSQRAFGYAGPSARNKLPAEVKTMLTLETKLRMRYYDVAYTLQVTYHNVKF